MERRPLALPDAPSSPVHLSSSYSSLAVSTLVHVGVILLLAGMTAEVSRQQGASLDTRWTHDDRRVEPQSIEVLPAPLPPEQAGGLLSQPAHALLGSLPDRLRVDAPSPGDIEFAASTDAILTSDGLADDVGLLAAVGDSGGEGTGEGEGEGEGDGFFGITAPGKRFVYVVDCSLSMNHPHDSPAKTRFKRLKLELVKSIGLMEPPQEFFIIFFNHDVLPMPSRTMQPALPEVKEQYLEWMTKVRANGNTDPRDAIRLAMKFQPDVIYFLTDGSFEYRARRDLGKLAQQRVAIHTFALGNREGEAVLQRLAERNGGKYHYIP